MDINIEMDLSQIYLTRSYYSILDFLSDIGGVKGSLLSLISWFLAIYNSNIIDNFMVQRIYKIKSENDTSTSAHIEAGKLDSLSLWWQSTASWIFCKICCKPNRTRQGYLKARSQLLQEINIIDFIKSRRYFNSALRLLLDKE